MFKLPNIEGKGRMKLRPPLTVIALAFFLLPAVDVWADILLKDKQPIDRGRGETIGGEIRWISCDGTRSTKSNPPYVVLKRSNECHSIGPDADANTGVGNSGLDPSVFGLACNMGGGAFTFGEEYLTCKVDDESLARYFFKGAHNGDRVRYETKGNKITLTYRNEKLSVDRSAWRGKSEFPGSP
jgi:hypothetical protein